MQCLWILCYFIEKGRKDYFVLGLVKLGHCENDNEDKRVYFNGFKDYKGKFGVNKSDARLISCTNCWMAHNTVSRTKLYSQGVVYNKTFLILKGSNRRWFFVHFCLWNYALSSTVAHSCVVFERRVRVTCPPPPPPPPPPPTKKQKKTNNCDLISWEHLSFLLWYYGFKIHL